MTHATPDRFLAGCPDGDHMPSFIPARQPANETARLNAVQRSGLMDTLNKSRFDIFTRLFRHIAEVPVAYTGLIDEARQYFLSENFTGCLVGTSEVAREETICQYALLETRPILIDDLRENDIYRHHPLVTQDPHWVFWGGFPLVTPEGYVLGTLCAVDFVPRTLSQTQIDLMRGVADELAISIQLQTDLQDAIADRAHEVLRELAEFGVTSVEGAQAFLQLCLDRPPLNLPHDVLASGLAGIGRNGPELTNSGRRIKTGHGLGPSAYRVITSPLHDSDLLDAMFGQLDT